MAGSSLNAAAVDALLAAPSNTGNIALVTYNWNPTTQLANYLAAQARVVAGVAGAQSSIIAVGDSTTLGFGGAANNYRSTVSYPSDLSVFLSQDGVVAQSDNFLGQGNNDFTVPDSRITLLGGAIWAYPFVAGGPVVVANGTGQGFAFTLPTAEVYNQVTIDYLDSGAGTLNISVDGLPTLATLQLGNTGLMMKQTINIPIGLHSEVSVTAGTGNQTDIEGASFANSVTPAVQVYNAGEGGAESTVVGDGVTPGPGEISSAVAIGANLALINFGINDILQGNLTAAQTTANIALMVNEFRASGTDPIIIIPQPISAANYATEVPTLRADIYQLATTLNVPVIDLSATYNNSAAPLLANGLLGSDGVHPSATLYADIASGIAELLTQAASSIAPVTPPPPVTPPVVAVPPAVTLAPAPTAASGATVVLGSATDAAGDPLSVTLLSDTKLPNASSIAVLSGALTYNPGMFSAAQAGADSLSYVVTDTTTGATTSETQSVLLTAPVVMTPAPVTTTPVATTIGAGPSSIVLEISEDAYLGDAQFTISVDGTQIGGTQTATALHAAQQDQQFTVEGNFAIGQHTVSVNFLNDAYAGTPQTDRNLYVDSVTWAGVTQATDAALLSEGPQSFNVGAPTAPVVTPPVVTPPVVAPPVVTPAPGTITVGSGTGPDTLVLQVAEDAFLGDAQFTVAVDGVQIGGIQTASASHAAGASTAFAVIGMFSGPHVATVDFLNDLYDGTPQTDRNLYVTSATLDGSTVPGAVLTELGAGPMSFAFQGPTAASSVPGSSPVMLNLAEDAYQGDAQFTVSVDGGPSSAPRTVTALNSLGQSEAFSLGDLSPGGHDIAVSFVNDLYAGTPATDRNLYVTGISVNGSAVPNASASILGDLTSHFKVVVTQ